MQGIRPKHPTSKWDDTALISIIKAKENVNQLSRMKFTTASGKNSSPVNLTQLKAVYEDDQHCLPEPTPKAFLLRLKKTKVT